LFESLNVQPVRLDFLTACGLAGELSHHSLPGAFTTVPNQDGSGTHSEVQNHLSTQTTFAEKSIRYGGEAAHKGEGKYLKIESSKLEA